MERRLFRDDTTLAQKDTTDDQIDSGAQFIGAPEIEYQEHRVPFGRLSQAAGRGAGGRRRSA
jgi:hypothetical protein